MLAISLFASVRHRDLRMGITSCADKESKSKVEKSDRIGPADLSSPKTCAHFGAATVKELDSMSKANKVGWISEVIVETTAGSVPSGLLNFALALPQRKSYRKG